MAEASYSKAQIDFLAKSFKGINIAGGAVRSGKTYAQTIAMVYFLIDHATPGMQGLITAKTLDAIERNIFQNLHQFLEQENMSDAFEFRRQPLRVIYKPKNIELVCLGASDDKAEARLRGMTAQIWVADEVTLYPEWFYDQCVLRLSYGQRVSYQTCNPDAYSHWLYQKYIKAGKANYFQFKLTDNPSLSKSYCDEIKGLYSGIFYKRFIEGEWGGDEDSLVLPEFQSKYDAVVRGWERPNDFIPMVSADIGGRNDFTFILFGYYDFTGNKIVIEDEVVFKKRINTLEMADAIRDKEIELWGDTEPSRYCDVDPRLIEDMNLLNNMLFIQTRKDDKMSQVNALRIGIQREEVIILPECRELVEHCQAACWKKTKSGILTYERSDKHGHFDGVDALVYFYRNANKRNPYKENKTWNQLYYSKPAKRNPFIPKYVSKIMSR